MFPTLNQAIDLLHGSEGATKAAVAIAWLLRHAAGMQLMVGATNAGRLRSIARDCEVEMTRQQW